MAVFCDSSTRQRRAPAKGALYLEFVVQRVNPLVRNCTGGIACRAYDIVTM